MTIKLKEKIGFYRPHKRVPYTGTLVNNATGEVYTPPARTKQQFVAECDINNILKQYKATGQLRHVSAKASAGAYADLPDSVDFQESMNTVLRAETAFATLPARLRNRFKNDPNEFLEFVADPANQKELIELGLATDKRPPAEAAPAPAGPPAKPPQSPPVAGSASEPPKPDKA